MGRLKEAVGEQGWGRQLVGGRLQADQGLREVWSGVGAGMEEGKGREACGRGCMWRAGNGVRCGMTRGGGLMGRDVTLQPLPLLSLSQQWEGCIENGLSLIRF